MKNHKNKILIPAVIITSALLLSAEFNTTRLEKISESMNLKTLESLPVKANRAFKEGEFITYRMHYGALNAGVASLEVKPEIIEVNNRKVYHIVTTGYSTGATDVFFKVRDRYETYMDKDALIPWLFVRRVNEGGCSFSQDYAFNHYTHKVDIGKNKTVDIPDGIQDMVSSFYSARNMDFNKASVGDVFSFNCFLDREVWPFKIKFMGREEIETDIGKFKALRFCPIVQRGRVFKREEDLNVWISDDDNHIVLRAQAHVIVGNIKMDITSAKNLANDWGRVYN